MTYSIHNYALSESDHRTPCIEIFLDSFNSLYRIFFSLWHVGRVRSNSIIFQVSVSNLQNYSLVSESDTQSFGNDLLLVSEYK